MNTDTTTAATETTEAVTTSADTAVTTSTSATEQAPGKGQGEGETPAAEATEPKDGEEAEAKGAPEAYEPFVLPEGFALEGERATVAEAYFRENNMDQAAAQKAIDLFVQMNAENLASLEAQRAQRIEDWGKQSREQFGKEFDQLNSDARKAVTALKTPELMEAFESEGWGNHPELIRVFATLGKLLGDDAPKGMGGETAQAEELSIADRMYPGMKK